MAVRSSRVLLLCVLLKIALPSLGLPTQTGTKPKGETSLDDLSDVELEPGEEDDAAEGVEDSNPGSQHLFPSFSSLFSGQQLSHSRQIYPEFTAPARSFNAEPPFHQRVGYSEEPQYSSAEDTDRVLGSGNFGIIPGGTYYGGSGDEAYARGVNSHGRPYRRPNPPPQYKLGGDFFAGFRDFADITTPPKSAYSNMFVVYANRNSTSASSDGQSRPKNIRELIEAEPNEDYEDEEDERQDKTAPKEKSKTKKKLSIFKRKQSDKESSKKFRSKAVDPLIALS